MENFKSFTIQYEPAGLIPPFSHFFVINGFNEKSYIKVELELKYIDRERLSEEEILEEGFSLNDDFSWKGKIAADWILPVCSVLNNCNYTSENPGEDYIYLKFDDGNKQQEGFPVNIEAVSYLIQELVQAIYETSGKESPLKLGFKNIDESEITNIDISAEFSTRTLKISRELSGRRNLKEIINPEWEKLKPVLKAIYIPDYLEEHGSTKSPNKNGTYLNPGDGRWYKFNEGVINPGKKKNTLEWIKTSIMNLAGETQNL
ncbi:MAG: hypothetical protein ACK40G_05905 [Cytophagaceae bacterium]